jgi:hypothetical protein
VAWLCGEKKSKHDGQWLYGCEVVQWCRGVEVFGDAVDV